jgi:hypothetical protein
MGVASPQQTGENGPILPGAATLCLSGPEQIMVGYVNLDL